MVATTVEMAKKATLVGPFRPALLQVVLCSASAIVSAVLTTVFFRWRPLKARRDLHKLQESQCVALDNLRLEAQEKTEEVQKLDKQLAQAQHELQLTRRQLEEANMEKAKYAHQLECAVSEASERCAAADMLNQKLLESGVRCDNAQRRLGVMEEERNNLRREVEANNIEIQRLKGNVEVASKKLEDTQQKYTRLQTEHDACTKKCREVEQQFSSLSTSKIRVERELTQKVQRLESDLLSTSKRRDELQAENVKSKEKWESVRKKMEAAGPAVSRMGTELEVATRQKEQLLHQLTAEQKLRHETESALSMANKRIKELEGVVSLSRNTIRRLEAQVSGQRMPAA